MLSMISSDKYRMSINTTIADIFADYNDPRKQMLIKRVRIAMEDLEIRMRNEVQGNNLANLQMLLKKQQTLKKMEEKVEQMSEQLEQKRERDNYLSNKFSEMQAEMNKSSDSQRHLHQKMKKMNDIIHQKDLQLSQKDEIIASLEKQLQEMSKQNQRLQMEMSKLETSLKKMRETYQHKTEQTELMIKIKEKRMEQSMNQSISNIQIRHQREKEMRQVEAKLKSPKIDKKNQRIQVSISNSPSPQPTVTRPKELQMTTRQPVRNFVDREVQTMPTQQKKIAQFIDNTPSTKAEKLQEIRLVYTATTKFTPQKSPPIPKQPKITKFYAVQTVSARVQTYPVIFQLPTPVKMQQTSQVFVEEDRSFMQYMMRQIEILKEKYVKMEQFHDGRYWQLLKIYENRPSQQHDLKEIEMLKVSLLEAKLELTKKDKQVANQRELYVKAKKQLYESQNNILLRRLNVKLGEQHLSKKPKMNQTCSFFYDSSPKRIHTQLYYKRQQLENEENVLIHTNPAFKIKRPAEEEIITVVKSNNSLKYRRNSLKTSIFVVDGYENRQKMSREYQKYSKSRTLPQ